MKKIRKLTLLAICLSFFIGINLASAGNIVIKGSTTVLPIAQKLAEAYMKDNPNIIISISGGGSGN
ncbi:MAG: phosphate ABC transporter substrate-binding protein, partial [archaeon]|nr:phosphate ABC transporter substrate-binding protein [archaeon]